MCVAGDPVESWTFLPSFCSLQNVADHIPQLVQGVRGSQAQAEDLSAQLALINSSQIFLQVQSTRAQNANPSLSILATNSFLGPIRSTGLTCEALRSSGTQYTSPHVNLPRPNILHLKPSSVYWGWRRRCQHKSGPSYWWLPAYGVLSLGRLAWHHHSLFLGARKNIYIFSDLWLLIFCLPSSGVGVAGSDTGC